MLGNYIKRNPLKLVKIEVLLNQMLAGIILLKEMF